jgi:hypothetical protein
MAGVMAQRRAEFERRTSMPKSSMFVFTESSNASCDGDNDKQEEVYA